MREDRKRRQKRRTEIEVDVIERNFYSNDCSDKICFYSFFALILCLWSMGVSADSYFLYENIKSYKYSE